MTGLGSRLRGFANREPLQLCQSLARIANILQNCWPNHVKFRSFADAPGKKRKDSARQKVVPVEEGALDVDAVIDCVGRQQCQHYSVGRVIHCYTHFAVPLP